MSILKDKISNGRVDVATRLQPPTSNKLFAMYDKIPANQCATYRDATLGQWNETPLSKAYFSKENIQIVQNGIRAGVYYKSNGQYTVGQQDCDTVKVIMRSVFLSSATNYPTDIPGQIAALNKMVIDYCVEHVYSEAKGYMKYLVDVGTLAVPLATPIMESQRDKNTYRMPTWF